MRTLFLLRHAKASRDDPTLDDFNRPLTERGLEDAARIGRLMADRGWWPARAFVSPATRTRQTWVLASREFPKRKKARPPRQPFGPNVKLPPKPVAIHAPMIKQQAPDNIPRVSYMPALYSADMATILSVVRGLPGEVEQAIVVGHNPSIAELANMLAANDRNSEPAALLREKYPTGALAVFATDAEWADLEPENARLEAFYRPKDLAEI